MIKVLDKPKTKIRVLDKPKPKLSGVKVAKALGAKPKPKKIKKEADPIELLKQLGNTPKRIAESLKHLGIRGIQNEAGDCPLALYLQKKNFPHAQVDGQSVCLEPCWLVSEQYPLPKPFEKFTDQFDNGKYPDLIVPEE